MLALKQEAPGAGSARTRLRDSLIVVQVAVSVLLLGVSGLLVRSFVAVHRGPGFDPRPIAMVRLRPSLIGYGAERSWAFQREAIRRLEAIPGVIAASPASVPPLPRWGRGSAVVTVPGGDRSHASLEASTTYVGPRYFEAVGVPLIEGREFDDRDGPRGAPAAIVNETLARRFWPRGGAAGNAIMLGDSRVEIVGVVKNFEYLTALDQPQPIAYLDFWQQDTTENWSHDSRTHIRVAGEAASMMPAILRAIASVDDDVPVADAAPLSDRIDMAFSQLRLARAFLVMFGMLAMVLSTIGLYASLAFGVAQRTREIAIRVALGAARIDVGRLVFARGAGLVAVGIVAGLTAAVMAGPLVAHLLYGVSARDPLTLAAGPSLVVLVALLAIWLPARRAMSVDPMAALRAE
jgi:predicted permease